MPSPREKNVAGRGVEQPGRADFRGWFQVSPQSGATVVLSVSVRLKNSPKKEYIQKKDPFEGCEA